MAETLEPVVIRVDELPGILYAIVKMQSGVRIPVKTLADLNGKSINILAYRDEDDVVFEVPDSITIH